MAILVPHFATRSPSSLEGAREKSFMSSVPCRKDARALRAVHQSNNSALPDSGHTRIIASFILVFRISKPLWALLQLDKIKDPVDDSTYWGIWMARAKSNTAIYEAALLCIPSDAIHSRWVSDVFSASASERCLSRLVRAGQNRGITRGLEAKNDLTEMKAFCG